MPQHVVCLEECPMCITEECILVLGVKHPISICETHIFHFPLKASAFLLNFRLFDLSRSDKAMSKSPYTTVLLTISSSALLAGFFFSFGFQSNLAVLRIYF